MYSWSSINLLKVLRYILLYLFFIPSLVSAEVVNWAVPFLKQRNYVNIGESACGPTSVAMLLKHYYPNSGIDMPEVYHSGTQTYKYDSGPAEGYKNVSWAKGYTQDPGLSIIGSMYRTYYKGSYAGMTLEDMMSYLSAVWGIATRPVNEDGVYSNIKNGPILGRVYAHGCWPENYTCQKDGKGWGHYVVIRGIDDKNTASKIDDVIYINDPYDVWNSKWDTAGQNKAISYNSFFGNGTGSYYKNKWFREALVLTPNDSNEQRKYTVVVDTGNNSFGGNASVNSFNLDDPTKWNFYYGGGGDWYYPKNGEYARAARWTPKISMSGYYQVSAKYRADSTSGMVTYNVHDKNTNIVATKTVNQYSKTSGFTYSIIADSVYLTAGSYVRATGVNQGTNVDAIKFKFLQSDGGSNPPPVNIDAASLVSQSPVAGQSYIGNTPFMQKWIMKNTGTTTWNGEYCLFPVTGGTQLGAGMNCVIGNVAPGKTYEFFILMKAPASQSKDVTYTQNWQLSRGLIKIGQQVSSNIKVLASNSPPPPPPVAFDGMKFVTDSPKDDTVFNGGYSFDKSWVLQNTGTSTWNSSYCLNPVAGGSNLGSGKACVSGTVAPGASYTFTVNMKAPAAQATEATHRQDWRLTNAAGARVGTYDVYARIKVKASGGTNIGNCPVSLGDPNPAVIVPSNEVRFVDIPATAIRDFLREQGSVLYGLDIQTYPLDPPDYTVRGGKTASQYYTDHSKAELNWRLDELKNNKPSSQKYDAAQIIYLVAKENDMNPIALLAFVQKEMGLISSSSKSYSGTALLDRLNKATGYGVTSGGPNKLYHGFLAQLAGTSWQMTRDLGQGKTFAQFAQVYNQYQQDKINLSALYNQYRSYFVEKNYSPCLSSAVVDKLPNFTSAALANNVNFPNKIYFSGTLTDDKGLATLTMMVSGPKGNDIYGFSNAISGKSISLSDYYFDSSNVTYAGTPGTYTVTLWAKDNAGQQVEGTKFTVTIQGGSVNAPANLRASFSGTNYTISWADNSTNEEGFKLEGSTDNKSWREVYTASANATSVSGSTAGVTPGTKVYYRIRAYRGSTYSAYSNVLEFVVPGTAAKTLTSVSVTCPASVNENSSASCSAVASFSDGSTTNSGFSWSENSSYASINSSSGTLTTNAVSSDQSVVVTASYTHNGATKSGSKTVTIKDVVALDSMKFVTDSPKDDTVFNGGDSFDKSWVLQNTGTSTWNSSYCLNPVTGGSSLGSVKACVSGTVAPGASHTFVVKMKAPVAQATEMTYRQDWRLTNAAGVRVGTYDVYARIKVKGGAKTLSSVNVTCPASVNENSSASCSAVASFSDGSTTNSDFSWSENSSYASINSSSGTLTTNAVSSDQSVVVTASYTHNGATKSGSKTLTIKDVPPAKTLSSVNVICPASVNENSSASCSAVASFSDGSTTNSGFSWSENSSYASINSSSGTLTTNAVSSDQSVVVTASYTHNGATKSGSKTLTIKDVPPAKTLSSVNVTCPASVNENSSASCSAVASFSDGSTTSSGFSWSENSSYASINSSSGTLTTNAVSSDQSVAVTASYTHNGTTKSGSKTLTIKDVPPAYDGKDPISMGCDSDATTVASKIITGGVIELRYSKKCGTNWARTKANSSSSSTYAKVTRSSDGRSYSYSGKGSIYTAMVYSPTTVSCAEGKIGTASASGACR